MKRELEKDLKLLKGEPIEEIKPEEAIVHGKRSSRTNKSMKEEDESYDESQEDDDDY